MFKNKASRGVAANLRYCNLLILSNFMENMKIYFFFFFYVFFLLDWWDTQHPILFFLIC